MVAWVEGAVRAGWIPTRWRHSRQPARIRPRGPTQTILPTLEGEAVCAASGHTRRARQSGRRLRVLAQASDRQTHRHARNRRASGSGLTRVLTCGPRGGRQRERARVTRARAHEPQHSAAHRARPTHAPRDQISAILNRRAQSRQLAPQQAARASACRRSGSRARARASFDRAAVRRLAPDAAATRARGDAPRHGAT